MYFQRPKQLWPGLGTLHMKYRGSRTMRVLGPHKKNGGPASPIKCLPQKKYCITILVAKEISTKINPFFGLATLEIFMFRRY